MSRTFKVEKLEDRVAPSLCNLLGGGLIDGGDGSGGLPTLCNAGDLLDLDILDCGDGGSGGGGGGGLGGDLIDLDVLHSVTDDVACTGDLLDVDILDTVLPAGGLPTTGDLPLDLPDGDLSDLKATVIQNFSIGDTGTHEGPLGLNGDGQIFAVASLEKVQADGHLSSFICETPLLETEPTCLIINTGLDS
jgi:hypothetical protein